MGSFGFVIDLLTLPLLILLCFFVGVRHVVDSGMSKESIYDPKRNVTVLTTTQISLSSAIQRKGRAGRTSSGNCYRLYSQEEEAAMRATQVIKRIGIEWNHSKYQTALSQ